MSAGERGKFDIDKFERYRAATGIKKRLLASELILENEPLIITIIEQLCGRGAKPKGNRMPAAARMGGCAGFGEIEFDDAMQAGRMAFAQALAAFDPARGKISYYFAQKARWALQKVRDFELHLARVPRGREKFRAEVALVGEPLELAALAQGELGGVVDDDEVTPDDIAAWEASGEWPESLEDLRARRERLRLETEARAHQEAAAKAYSLPAVIVTGWQAFLAGVKFESKRRTPTWDVFDAYRRACRQQGDEALGRAPFLAQLRERQSVRERSIWMGNERRGSAVVRGIVGIRLAS